MNSSFARYQKMRRAGASAEVAYRQAKKDGLDLESRARMLSSVYLASYAEAVRIGREAGDLAPSILDDPTLTPGLRAAVRNCRRKKENSFRFEARQK